MINRIESYIRKERLLSREGLHIVALSGGADSVALLRVLLAAGYRVEAAHCNFHLRGDESDRDEQFVKNLCQKNDVPLHLIHFDTAEYASLHQVSIEMAARELRYRYFDQLRQDIGAETVCVAHHRDDAVETFLMNLLRGAGIHGLTGIRPRNGHIVRPLLCVSRQDILQYLDSIGQDYVTDSTNLVDDVLRNKIRLRLIPLLNQLSPAASDNIARSAAYLSESEKVYNDGIRRCGGAWARGREDTPASESNLEAQWGLAHLCEVHEAQGACPQCAEGNVQPLSLPISDLKQSPSPHCLLHELLSPLGFNRSQIDQILSVLNSTSGKEFSSPSHTLVIDRDHLIVEPISSPLPTLRIPEPGNYRTSDQRLLKVESISVITISKTPDCATIDLSKVKFPLTLRPVREGDAFCPFGMTGHRLVSDFLTDLKLSVLEKRRQLVVTDATDTILWLVGLRTDNRFRVTPDTTTILRLTFLPSK
jgi:tRNA(Ile)-lysidine synthase